MENALRQELIERIESLSSKLTPQLPEGVAPSLKKFINIKAVVFDVYGTMFISGTGDISLAGEGDSSQAITEALNSVGFKSLQVDVAQQVSDYYDRAVNDFMKARKEEGIDYPEVDIVKIWQKVLHSLLEKNVIAGECNEDQVRRFAVEFECRSNPIWPMPSLRDTLQEIVQQDLELGIVSNSQFYTPLMFDAMLGESITDIGFNPDLCVWSYQHLIGKPSTLLYEKLKRVVDKERTYLPEEVLYVGNDMLKDVYPAQKLGFKTVIFAGDSRSYKPRKDDERCKNIKADAVITSFEQILDCL